MTSQSVSRLNRDILILSRHLLGDSAIGIAPSVHLHHNQVSRIIKRVKQNPRYIQAARMRIREFENRLVEDGGLE